MRNSLLVVLLVATAACGAYRFPGPAGGSGTVSGRVIATPCGPVEPIAQKCLGGPSPDCVPNSPNGSLCGTWPMPGLELVFTNGGASLTAKTDSGGDYSIELPSGTWTVDTTSYVRIVTGPRTLSVSAGSSIVADYVVDTGIRAASQPGQAIGAPTPADGGARFRTTGR
jgi:hypothetical protein